MSVLNPDRVRLTSNNDNSAELVACNASYSMLSDSSPDNLLPQPVARHVTTPDTEEFVTRDKQSNGFQTVSVVQAFDDCPVVVLGTAR